MYILVEAIGVEVFITDIMGFTSKFSKFPSKS